MRFALGVGAPTYRGPYASEFGQIHRRRNQGFPDHRRHPRLSRRYLPQIGTLFSIDSRANPYYTHAIDACEMPMTRLARILVVDDELSVRAVLERILRKEGFQVSLAACGKEALQAIENQRPDVMILDLNLPDLSGDAVCQKIRKDPLACSVSILILTGRASEGLPAECLNGGADDYLAKPFDIKELIARVRALLRRPRLYTADDSVLQKGPLSLHVGERRVSVKGWEAPSLAPKEFELLKQLLLHAPKVIDKNILALAVWGVPADRLHRRTLDVHMRRIRQKIGPKASRCLKTVPVIGYQWLDAA